MTMTLSTLRAYEFSIYNEGFHSFAVDVPNPFGRANWRHAVWQKGYDAAMTKALEPRPPIRQGHLYQLLDMRVIAMESSDEDEARVAPIVDGNLGPSFVTLSKNLTALPMRYFHGQVPT